MLVATTQQSTIQKKRNSVKSSTKLLTAGIAALALTGGIGATIASADTPAALPAAGAPALGSAPAAAPAAAPKAKQNGKHRSLQARALHGEATVGGKKKQRVVDFQRGSVTKVSSTSITVKSVDGFTATYTVDAKTKVRKEKKAATIATIKTADRVRVRAVEHGSTATAKVIRDHGAK
jgi:hypothetical protein